MLKGNALFWKAQALMLEDKLQDAQRAAEEAENCFKNAQSDQGQGACLHLSGTCDMIKGEGLQALDTWDKALAFAQRAKDPFLEYEISTSIFNVQRCMQQS